jgi:hypothetical protein
MEGGQAVRSSTETLIKAMRIVSAGNDGVVSAATAEAAQRLEEQQERIAKLEQENDALRADLLLWNEKECK